MSDEFHRTRMGQKFYERDVPTIADNLGQIAEHLRALALAKPEGAVVEMVWIVHNLDTRVPIDTMLAFATEDKACDYVRTQLSITHQSTFGGLPSHLHNQLNAWQAAETKKPSVIVGPYRIECLVVQL